MLSRRPLVPLLCFALVAPHAALAAGSNADYPACAGRTPTADDVAAAKKTYELGNRYLGEADYDRAINYYRDAYRTDCTAHKLLGYIARAYELKGDRAEAVRALELYLERAPRADDRPTVERRIANLKAQMAASPAPTPAAATPTATTSAPAAPAPSSSEPPPAARPPAEARPPSGEPTSPVPREGGPGLMPWVVVGVGAAAATAGGILYGVGTSRTSDAERACASHTDCEPADAARGNDGRTMQIAGIALMAGGGLTLASGIAWKLLSKRSTEGDHAVVFPLVGEGQAGFGVRGRF